MTREPGYFTIAPGTYVAMLATLVLLGTFALFYWLEDLQEFPWRDEDGWVAARIRQPQATPERLAQFATSHVELERRCVASCGHYRVTIWGTGRVVFDGLRGTCADGTHVTQIKPRLAVDLLADLQIGQFRELTWIPDYAIDDAPNVTIRLDLPGLKHTQKHYLGDARAPLVLVFVENAIDRLAGTARWLPRNQDGHAVCR